MDNSKQCPQPLWALLGAGSGYEESNQIFDQKRILAEVTLTCADNTNLTIWWMIWELAVVSSLVHESSGQPIYHMYIKPAWGNPSFIFPSSLHLYCYNFYQQGPRLQTVQSQRSSYFILPSFPTDLLQYFHGQRLPNTKEQLENWKHCVKVTAPCL